MADSAAEYTEDVHWRLDLATRKIVWLTDGPGTRIYLWGPSMSTSRSTGSSAGTTDRRGLCPARRGTRPCGGCYR